MSLKLGGLRGDGESVLEFWGDPALKSQGSPEAQQTVKQKCNLEEKVKSKMCSIANFWYHICSWNKTNC